MRIPQGDRLRGSLQIGTTGGFLNKFGISVFFMEPGTMIDLSGLKNDDLARCRVTRSCLLTTNNRRSSSTDERKDQHGSAIFTILIILYKVLELRPLRHKPAGRPAGGTRNPLRTLAWTDSSQRDSTHDKRHWAGAQNPADQSA